jgi:hypothetical protein
MLEWILSMYVKWIPLAHGDEPSGSINGGKFLNQISGCQLLRNDLAPWSLFNG